MTDDYTPTTKEVRVEYTSGRFNDGIGPSWKQTEPDFDRWLAAHDRETAARAWDEGFEEPRECCGLCPLRSCPWDNGGDGPTNPYHEED